MSSEIENIKKIKQRFDEFDKDGSGYITIDEYKALMDREGVLEYIDCDEELSVMDKMGKSNNKVSFYEYLEYRGVSALSYLLHDILEDGKVSPKEFMALRDYADMKCDALVQNMKWENSALSAFQKSADVTMQLLQTAVLDLKEEKKKSKLTKGQLASAKTALSAQVGYVSAGSKYFIDKVK